MTMLIEVLQLKAEPYKVTLTRGQKGTYGWEITVTDKTILDLEAKLWEIDCDLRKQFGGGEQTT